MAFEHRHHGGLLIVAEYEPRQLPFKWAVVGVVAVTALGTAVYFAWARGVLAGALVLGRAIIIVGPMAWLVLAMHRAATGRRVVLDGSARTLTFIRPLGFWLARPGPDRVVPLDRVRSVREMQSQGVCWLVISGEDVLGRRVSLRIDSEMTNFAELWAALRSIYGEQAYSPWYQSHLGAVGLVVGSSWVSLC